MELHGSHPVPAVPRFLVLFLKPVSKILCSLILLLFALDIKLCVMGDFWNCKASL